MTVRVSGFVLLARLLLFIHCYYIVLISVVVMISVDNDQIYISDKIISFIGEFSAAEFCPSLGQFQVG